MFRVGDCTDVFVCSTNQNFPSKLSAGASCLWRDMEDGLLCGTHRWLKLVICCMVPNGPSIAGPYDRSVVLQYHLHAMMASVTIHQCRSFGSATTVNSTTDSQISLYTILALAYLTDHPLDYDTPLPNVCFQSRKKSYTCKKDAPA